MQTKLPVVRSDGLLIERVGDETVVYDTDSKEAHCLGPLAAVVFELCDGHVPVGELGAIATGRLGREVTTREVESALSQLEDRSLLDTAFVVRDGLSRRELMRKGAFAGAVTAAIPLVTSIAVPTSAAAVSVPCIPCGGECQGSNTCCVGNDPNNQLTCKNQPDGSRRCLHLIEGTPC